MKVVEYLTLDDICEMTDGAKPDDYFECSLDVYSQIRHLKDDCGTYAWQPGVSEIVIKDCLQLCEKLGLDRPINADQVLIESTMSTLFGYRVKLDNKTSTGYIRMNSNEIRVEKDS